MRIESTEEFQYRVQYRGINVQSTASGNIKITNIYINTSLPSLAFFIYDFSPLGISL